jgi:hypothetical protein
LPATTTRLRLTLIPYAAIPALFDGRVSTGPEHEDQMRALFSRSAFPLAALLAALALAGPLARPAGAQVLQPRPDDEVTLDLVREGHVETATAKVTIGFELAGSGNELTETRAKLRQILSGLAQAPAWRFTRFDRIVDPAGLERWRVSAEARLSEKELGGLPDKVKAASKPGLQLRVAQVDFTPTLAEREAGFADLRGEIYAAVKAEVARLKQVFPERDYRVKQIQFSKGEAPVTMRAMAMAPAPKTLSPEQADSVGAEPGPTVARRIELAATVVLGYQP